MASIFRFVLSMPCRAAVTAVLSALYGKFKRQTFHAMRIYTSYFGNLKNLRKQGIVGISIALKTPDFFYGSRLREVAPTENILHLKENEYIQAYTSQILSRINPVMLYDRIREMSQGKDVALLCYEDPTKFCHRHLLSKFLNDCIGAGIQEFYTTEQLRKLQMAAMPKPPTLFD